MRLSIEKLLLYMRTASHLKKKQMFYRVLYGLRNRIGLSHQNNPSLDGAQLWKPLLQKVPFLPSPCLNVEDILKGKFSFLNELADLGDTPDWAAPGKNRLWRYNLHYFSYLNLERVLPEKNARHLIEHWIGANPPGTSDAWDPYPTSLRLVNWIKYLSTAPSASSWADRAIQSGFMQMSWLEKHLEYHLLANHLFKNAKALIFGGLFYCGEKPGKWLLKGIDILSKELREQILPDGGHFERSPMYHSMILEDCLDLLNVFEGGTAAAGWSGDRNHSLIQQTAEQLFEAASKMTGFLQGMIHPDGRISLFNDAAFGIEHEPQRLFSYYEAVTGKKLEDSLKNASFQQRDDKNRHKMNLAAVSGGTAARAFPESGYFVMAPGPGDKLIADCGAIGPDFQPGHSHCDLLSFELSLDGRRVIVDSGCSKYEQGEIRNYNRSNSGHNSVSIDGRNQSEVWGAHRCARRARPIYARLLEGTGGETRFEGAHDGYKRLPGKPVHHRSITWKGNEIQILDRIEGHGMHSVESRLHVHPDLVVSLIDGAALIIDGSRVLTECRLSCGGKIETIPGWYSPEFGVQRECTVLRVYEKHATLPLSLCWIMKLHVS